MRMRIHILYVYAYEYNIRGAELIYTTLLNRYIISIGLGRAECLTEQLQTIIYVYRYLYQLL